MKNYILAFLVAFVLSLILTYIVIKLLKKFNARQEILQYVVEHSSKSGTPTMGGIAFVVTISLCSLLFCSKSQSLYVCVAVFVGYAIVGFLDDYIKVRYKRNLGLKAYQKIVVQLAIAVAVSLFIYNEPSIGSSIVLPISNKQVDIGKFVVLLTIFVFIACTNGVNLTDGLDGLSASTTICYFLCMFLLLLQEKTKCDNLGCSNESLQCDNMLYVCAIAIGALLSYLLFNCHGAKVFMGDTGSLALGALVSVVAIFTRYTLFIPIVGIMYVVSCLSVIIQVVYFKLSNGKRVFLMAPFHHHLQHKGLSENRICLIYSTITILAGAVIYYLGG